MEVNLSFLFYIMDDILFANSDSQLFYETKYMLSKVFTMKDPRETLFILSIKIHKDSLIYIRVALKSLH